MKLLLYPISVALCASLSFAESTTETRPLIRVATETPSASAQLAGKYAGTWKSDPDSGGDLSLTLKQDSAVWSGEASFTFQGGAIATAVKSLKVDGTNIEIVLGWEIDGTPGVSRLTGIFSNNALRGTYESETPDGTTTGTWAVTRM
jgi:hypothetical protein